MAQETDQVHDQPVVREAGARPACYISLPVVREAALAPGPSQPAPGPSHRLGEPLGEPLVLGEPSWPLVSGRWAWESPAGRVQHAWYSRAGGREASTAPSSRTHGPEMASSSRTHAARPGQSSPSSLYRLPPLLLTWAHALRRVDPACSRPLGLGRHRPRRARAGPPPGHGRHRLLHFLHISKRRQVARLLGFPVAAPAAGSAAATPAAAAGAMAVAGAWAQASGDRRGQAWLGADRLGRSVRRSVS
jgi:hypothetical protein